MKVTPISNPLDGERVVGVYPAMAPRVEADWRRRLNYYTGRALSDVALTIESNGHSGRLALQGQMVSPGVVNGLEVGLEIDGANAYYHIAVGQGMAVSGEDVAVTAPVRIRVTDVPVYAPSALLDALTDEEEEVSEEEGVATPPPGPLLPRRLGPALSDLIEESVELPRVGILLLQPVSLDTVGRNDADDPCEQDPQNFAFEDWQIVDGCRLVWYAWPSEWLSWIPQDAAWRNRLAHLLFAVEEQFGPSDFFPWELIGVPIALVGFTEDWRPLFVDRHAVVREGGRPKRRSALVLERGSPFVWQARIQQFNAQVAEGVLAGRNLNQLAQEFAFLPPAGLLPKNAVDFSERQSHFFPGRLTVTALPAPLEQLDIAFEASASLAPFDLSAIDQVEVLAPVAQPYYEPQLLQTEQEDTDFALTFARFNLRRNRWLRRRLDVRDRAALLYQAIKGAALTFPAPDPDAVGAETPDETGVEPNEPEFAQPEGDYGTVLLGEGDQQHRVVSAMIDLRNFLINNTPLNFETSMDALNAHARDHLVEADLPPELAAKIRRNSADNIMFFKGVMTQADRALLVQVLEQAGVEAPVAELDLLQKATEENEIGKLDLLGLEKYILFLENKVRRANDHVDLSFVRAQTDIYRLRRLMLGTLDASRLATSPVLAAIAQDPSALSSAEGIRTFLDRVKEEQRQKLQAVGDVQPAATGLLESGAAGLLRGGSKFVGGGTVLSPEFIGGGKVTLPIGERLTGVIGSQLGQEVILAPEISAQLGKGGIGDILAGQGAEAVITKAGGAGIGEFLGQATSDRGVLFGGKDAVAAIVQQPQIIGETIDIRNVTVGERLVQNERTEVKSATVASKFNVIKGVADLDLTVDDLQVATKRYDAQGRPTLELKEIKDLRGNLGAILDDPNPAEWDEAQYFSASVDRAEETINVLRRIEGRIQEYNTAIARCRQTLADVNNLAFQTDRRLKEIGDRLAEARHDVAVAQALWDEEKARVAAVNTRRQKIIAEQVTFLAFRRPRTSEARQDLPIRVLDPGLRQAPIPACRQRLVAVPSELRNLVNLLRNVPLKWIKRAPDLLNYLDRIDLLQGVVKSASQRAQFQLQTEAFTLLGANNGVAEQGLLGGALQKVLRTQFQQVSRQQAIKSQLNLATLAQLSWKETFQQAQEIVSLADLSDASHGHSQVASLASARLDEIAHVAGCLYELFGKIPGDIRLLWAERLSQFDAPVDLRDLASLPRWGDETIDRLARHDMQELVDWLYDSIDRLQSEAVAIMNDVVRVSILLASHAPVNQIIAGRVQQEAPVQVGGRVKVTIPVEKVRIGMPAILLSADQQVIAEAIVDDVIGSQAVTRIVNKLAAATKIDVNAQVHFGNTVAHPTAGHQSLMAQYVMKRNA